MTEAVEPPSRWLRRAAPEWVHSSRLADSARMRRFEDFSAAISRLLDQELSHGNAESVVEQLRPTLDSCDSLSFDSPAECLAYSCWHLADRYGRIQHALDMLAVEGHLPIRRKPVSLLEVGAGPAPAAYAVADYYASLIEWCVRSDQPLLPTQLGVPATLDRGSAWGHVVHRLSEMVLLQSRDGDRVARTFGTLYGDLEGFSVRRLHNEAVASLQRAHFEAEDEDGEWEFEVLHGEAPPSAYDLIVMCNFLTDSTIAESLANELTELAGSLTPGGVLLVLGSANESYHDIYNAVDRFATDTRRGALKPILTDLLPLKAQASPAARDIVATGLVRDLRALRSRAPDLFDAVLPTLPGDVRALDVEHLRLPMFRVRAYKREGKQALTQRERRRIARRRSQGFSVGVDSTAPLSQPRTSELGERHSEG